MNLCTILGHKIDVNLTLIPKGTPAKGFFGGRRALYARTYYGADVVCERCKKILVSKNTELPEELEK